MLKFLRAGVVVPIVTALVCTSGGVATADPVPVPDVVKSKDTADGYAMRAALTKMTINAVPNMSATAFTREGFVTVEATLFIDAALDPEVTEVVFTLKAQEGCQIDLKSGGFVEFNPSIASSLSGLDTTPDTFALAPTGQLNPTFHIELRPGTVHEDTLGAKAFSKEKGNPPTLSDDGTLKLVISVEDADIKVESCGGLVSLRLVATAKMSTRNSDDEINLFGDILPL